MYRVTLLIVVLGLPTSGRAQQLDPSGIRPVTSPVRDAGTFDWDTKRWISGPRADRLAATSYTVFNNTCTWTGGSFYFGGFEHCEELVDTGRIPSATTPLRSLEGTNANGVHVSGNVLSGATDAQIINTYQFAYCTFYAAGAVDITIGFYDNLRGDCASGIPVRGRSNQTSPYQTLSQQAVSFGTGTAYFDFGTVAGNPLPGSTTNGAQTCWTVTIAFANNGGFCLTSEGNGAWSNDQTQDLFSWSFSHDMVNSLYGDNGPLVSGEPLTGGYGAGAYNLPVGSGANLAPCGTGFGTSVDGWWLNVAGSGAGWYNTLNVNAPTPATHKTTCAGAAGFGTNCYWFGGWPANPLGSFWMVMTATGDCNGCSNRAQAYCTAGTSSAGCNALISGQGVSSASAPSGFYLQASGVEGGKTGLFYYGTAAKSPAVTVGTSSSFQCVQPPVRRSALLTGGGSGGVCDGSFETDLNARWSAKPNHNPGAGGTVYAQLWYRDPANTSNQTTARSDALSWTVCP
jgi:hypothetical protein